MKLAWFRRIAVLALLFEAATAEAQNVTDVTVELTGRLQYQFNTTSVAAEPASTFETRRVRLGVELSVGEWLTGMIEPEYALGNVTLRQTWIDFAFADAVALRAGQMKKPFSLIQLTSSTQWEPIERGVRIRGLDDALDLPIVGEEQAILDALDYMSYDMGVALHGAVGPLGYEAGIYNGAGADARDRNNDKALAARLTYALPLDLPIALGAAVSKADLGDLGAEVGGTAYSLDVQAGRFRGNHPHVIAEIVTGDNHSVGDATFLAAQGMIAWFRPVESARIEGFEPVARISWGDPNRDMEDDAGTLLTPGINLYFHGRNRLMFNWDVFLPQADGIDRQHAWRAQAQLHF